METDLQYNVVIIEPDPRVEIDLATIPQQIRDSGFQPSEMTIRAVGTVEIVGPETRFQIRGWSGSILLVGGGVSEGKQRISARVLYIDEPIRLLVEDPSDDPR